jgi:hypothetical protein
VIKAVTAALLLVIQAVGQTRQIYLSLLAKYDWLPRVIVVGMLIATFHFDKAPVAALLIESQLQLETKAVKGNDEEEEEQEYEDVFEPLE